MPKQKSVYNVDVFRGLDKENKLTKVEPFRASDGQNFIIDSDTLKTRPAIKYVDEIPFNIEANDFVLDWYEFKDVTIYVTRFHVYASYNGQEAINETDDDFIVGNFGVIDFDNNTPLFEEEKDALFIFGLNNVFVFSYIQTPQGVPHKYVLYTINRKPVNTFTSGSDYFEQFDRLPFAYEPTLFIGDTSFEDINLLSNIRKYSTFAASGNVTEGGSQSYYFPTDYQEGKHGDFSFEVNFYEGRFENLENIYPIFLGIEGEHFDDGTLTDFGLVDNPSSLITIQDIFYPTNSFEFFGTSNDANPTVISDIVGLDQDWFFKARVFNDDSKDVFNYLLEYIRANSVRLIDEATNHLLGFNVSIEYNAIYKDETTNFVVETKVERANIIVYAQLRSLEIDSFQFVSEETQGSDIDTTENLSDAYPAYPTTTGTFTDFNISDNPLQVTELSLGDFRNSARNLLKQNRDDIVDGENVRVFGQYFEETSSTNEPTIDLLPFAQWLFFRQNSLTNTSVLSNPNDKTTQYDPQDPFPSYPNFTADATFDISSSPIELDNFSQSDFVTAATNYFNNNPGAFTDGDRVAIRGQYFERETQGEPASVDVNTDRSTWTYYKDFNITGDGATFTDPGGAFTKTLSSTTSNNLSLEYFDTQFDNYVSNNRESFRGNIGQTGKLQLTSSNTSTSSSTYNLNSTWSIFTGPFPTFIQSKTNIPSSSSGTLDLDTNLTYMRAKDVSGSKSNIQFRQNNSAISTINFEDLYPSSFGGQCSFSIPTNADEVVISIYKAPGVVDDTTFANSHNTSNINILARSITTTNSKTAYREVSVVDTGEVEFSTNVTFGNASTFPPHLAYSDGGLPVLENVFVDYDTDNPETIINQSGFVSAVDAKLLTLVDSITEASGDAYAEVFAQGTGSSGSFGASIVIKFSYVKSGQSEYQLRQSFVLLGDVENIIEEDTSITIDDPSTIDGGNYPTFDDSNADQIQEVPLVSQTNEQFDYTSTFRNQIETYLLSVVDTFNGVADEQYNGFAKVKVQTEFGSSDSKGVSIVIPFTYSKEFTRTIQRRQSMVYTAQIVKVQEVIGTNQLYEFFFDDLEKRFELRLKDYFYDYNNEPSISVRIAYQFNPDYSYIANSKFGTTFGSENRLFLAGNEEFPNIDRYNVSNDLLGDNQRNQSYELSYFPTKNFRVLGGKGAINGYVTATDSILYVTKEDYPNDNKLFVRQRVLDENGVLGYTEAKTSVNKTPLNNRCIVRFNNDVVMLTKNGLYALELSENVLTDERLLKLRSGFINKDIISKIENHNEDEIFILENNLYMYIFIGQHMYVADSRYTDRNDNNIIENLSYEIVYWTLPQDFKTGHVTKNTFKILNKTGKFIYTLDERENKDDRFVRYDAITNTIDVGDQGNNAFAFPIALQFLITNPQDYTLRFYEGFKVVGRVDVDYTYDNGVVTYLNSNAFRMVDKDKTFYFKDAQGEFQPFVIKESTPLQSFEIDPTSLGDKDVIYEDISQRPLYISMIYTFNQVNYVRLSPYPQSEVIRETRRQGETDAQYISRLLGEFKDNEDYFFPTNGMKNLIVSEDARIHMIWVSNISDMGNKLVEKTSYRLNLYATKQDKENTINFGYKTRRRSNIDSEKGIRVSNPNTFNQLNFENFGMSTFSETGLSMPMKENNFLYVQFYIQGFGQVEVNSFSIIYKNNRQLKSVG